MIRLAEVVRRYRNELLTEYGDRLLPSHYRALDAIEQCRSGAIGEATWSCDQCQLITYTPLSCGHRHCPTCQNHESTQWLQRQLDKQLPANYFLLTHSTSRATRHDLSQPTRKLRTAVSLCHRYHQWFCPVNQKTVWQDGHECGTTHAQSQARFPSSHSYTDARNRAQQNCQHNQPMHRQLSFQCKVCR